MFFVLAKLLNRPLFFTVLVIQVLFFASCTVVKNYPDRPFVYQTNIELQGKFKTDERKELLSRLEEQLHDSINARGVQKLIGWERGPRLFYTVIDKPPVYDSLNADQSIVYMRALLNTMGYFRDTISYNTNVDTISGNEGTQLRTTINFLVNPGKLIRLDSIAFNLGHDTLQKITEENKAQSLLQKGQPFSSSLISTELDRLTDVYRNNGYLRFSREELIAVWDTVGLALIAPTLDPFEQLEQLELLRQRRENPTADVELRLRVNEDTSHLIRYYVGDVTVYPDLSTDTTLYIPTETTHDQYQIVSYRNLYKPRVIAENIFLNRGDLYRLSNELKTRNRFNSVGSWRIVTVDPVPRAYTDTVDFIIRLTPARKYVFDANIEGSQNWGNIFSQGNLVGFNFSFQNRNFARGANLANTSFRFGTEISPEEQGRGKFAQTLQFSLGNSIQFPRVIPRFLGNEKFRENSRTIFSLNGGYTSRFDFFNLTSVNTSWGYEFNWKNKLFSLRLPNVEFALLDTGKILSDLIKQNASYQYIFNGGLVVSTIAGYTVTGGRNDVTRSLRLNGESSGILLGLIRSKAIERNLQRFVRFDADFRQTHKIRRSAFAWRMFAGVGYQLRSEGFRYNQNLPFYKSYIAGGANSMRAWQLRKLGPGSTIRPFSRESFPDRFGDMQLELNAEYRFYLTDIQGVKLNSALFTDIGNIWFMRKNDLYPGGEFRFDKLGKDLAIGLGTGLRVDFGLFLIRVDYAYKVKDPSPDKVDEQNKWFYKWKLTNGQLQLGVTYPF